MANNHDDRDLFNPNSSGIKKAAKIIPTIPISTPKDNSMMHAHASQESTKRDHLMENELPGMVMAREECHKEPKGVVNSVNHSDLMMKSSSTERFQVNEATTTFDHSIQLKHQAQDSSSCMGKKVRDKDHIQLSAQADPSDAMSLFVMTKPPNDSNKQPSEQLRCNHNELSDVSQSEKETQQELSRSKHMPKKAPPIMMNDYQYALFANTMSVHQEGPLEKEGVVARDRPSPTDNKSQPLPSKHVDNMTELRKDHTVARSGCAQLTDHMECTSSLGEEEVVAQCSHRSQKQPLDQNTGDFSNDESRHKNDMDTSQEDVGITLEKRSETRSENGTSMFTTQNFEDTLQSTADENKKDLSRQKAALAHAPPGDLLMRGVHSMEATIPPDVPPGNALIQTHQLRPGAHVIVPSGSAAKTTQLQSAHAKFSGHNDFEAASQQDVMSNHHVQGHRDDAINIDDGQKRTSIFAEVVVWYKCRLYRWRLVAFVVFVVLIIVLGFRFGAGASVPTPSPAVGPTLVQPPPPAELIACSFLSLSMDVCRETTSSEGCQFNSTIPSELGVLTSLTYLDLSSNQLTGTIPSQIGAMTSLDYLSLWSNQLTCSIPSKIAAITGLTYLDLNENQSTGTIPSEMGALTSLTYLDLSSNHLTGTIPSEVGAMTSLNEFILWSNQLTGTIPSEIAAMTSLTYLDLYENQLNGAIPSQMGSITSLIYLDLSVNQLTGTVPSELTYLNESRIDLFNNSLRGTISSELCQSAGRIYIDCSKMECSCCYSFNETTYVTTPCN